MEALRDVFEGRDVVLASGVVQSKTGLVAMLRDLGAGRIVVVGTMGTGPAPDAETVLVEPGGDDPVEEFRHWERIAADPPAHVRAVLDELPDALILLGGFEASTTFGGRPVFGARPPAWTALEDKTTIDALWDELGIARPPSTVVPVAEAAGLPRPAVWSGDASQGFNGGVVAHPVHEDAAAAAALEHLAPRCERVRVSPFVEGIPCSIHGFVTSDGVAVLRPVELLTLRASRPPWFRMCGCATTYDPAPQDREEMRSVARRVGESLRDRVDYRGFFTVDGIMSADGWLPTELNPRPGAGLVQLRAAAVELRYPLLNVAAIAGAIDPVAADLEARLLTVADDNRVRSGHCVVNARRIETEEVLERDGITVTLGPGAAGGFLAIRAEEHVAPVGASFAPVAARAIALADEHWELGIGPLTPAKSVR